MTEPTCDQIQTKMSDALGAAAATEELQELELHVRACRACRAQWDRFMLQDRALGEIAGAALAPALETRIHDALATSGRRFRLRKLLLLAAAIPFAITAGVVFLFGPGDHGAAVAVVESVSGEVWITSRGARERAWVGSPLGEGVGIVTPHAGCQAAVRFPDGTLLELEGNTSIDRLTESSRGKELFVSRGTLNGSVAPQPQARPMNIDSPQARATVVGTRFRAAVQPSSTRLEVTEGKVRFRRTGGQDWVDLPAGSYAVAAPGSSLVARLLSGVATATVVEAGQTFRMNEDLVLSGGDTLEVKGTSERPCKIAGNHHRIRTSGEWTGRVRITHCEIGELGDLVTFSPEGRIVSQAHALDLSASNAAQVSVESSTFRGSSSINLRLDGTSEARFVNNVCLEDSIVHVDKARERSIMFFEVAGSSPAPKFFQGNRIYRSGVQITGKNWMIGGDTDAESNLVIGLRAGLFAYGEGTVVRGNYLHVLMPRTPEFPYWSQVATFTAARGALAEHNVIRDGEWIVQFVEGEFRNNLICDINDHNLLRNASTGRIHHNIFVAGKPDHPPGQMGGCIFIVYPPKDGQEGAEIFNNTFDAGGTMNVPGIEVNPGGFVKSLRNNVFYNFAHQEKYISSAQAMVRPIWNETLTDPGPARLGYADYNAFFSPAAKVKRNYALSVQGKTERRDDGFAKNDLPRGGAPNDQVDPMFKGPIPATFAFSDDDLKAGKVTVAKILATYRDAYAPAPGSPLLGAGDPADGGDIPIGAVGVGKSAKHP